MPYAGYILGIIGPQIETESIFPFVGILKKIWRDVGHNQII